MYRAGLGKAQRGGMRELLRRLKCITVDHIAMSVLHNPARMQSIILILHATYLQAMLNFC